MALGPGRGHSGAALHPGEKIELQLAASRAAPVGADAWGGLSCTPRHLQDQAPPLHSGGRDTGRILSGLTSGH